jgi:hypothetical protein
MEVSIFPADSVRAQKVKFIEARLHSDTKDAILRKRIAGLIETVARSKAQPIYVAMDPSTELERDRFNGMVLNGPDEFAEFLADMAAAIGTSP